MKKTLSLCVCVAALAAACSTAPKTDDVEVTGSTKATEDIAVSMLDVHEMILMDPEGGAFLEVASDGAVTILDERFVLGPGHYITISPDGVVTMFDGEPILRLEADGALVKQDGSAHDVTIAEDGTCRKGGSAEAIAFDDDGNMGGPGEVGVVTHTNGEDGPRARRALALAFVGTMFHAELAIEQMARDFEEPVGEDGAEDGEPDDPM